jgi:myo-inositol 2-dehydrogenase/D-chiro-inositol 1-dehydrogenase
VILRTASGRICQILNSRRCAFGYDQRIEVFGRDGMLLAGNETATRVVRADARGFVFEPALPFFLERYRAAYAAEIADFARALAGESVELATGEDGLRALELADAADRSRRTGLPIRLS